MNRKKEIVFSVTPPDKADAILEEIGRAAGLDKPGKFIAFVVPIERMAGVVHRGLIT